MFWRLNLQNFVNRQLKQLHKQYKKIYADLKKKKASFFDVFCTQLRELRDKILVAKAITTDADMSKHSEIFALCLAIAEIEQYYNCISNYYDCTNNVPRRKDTSKTDEEVAKEFAAEQADHWMFFWNLLEDNLERWLEFDTNI